MRNLSIGVAALVAAAGAASAQWSENFDSYNAGPLSGQGGWAIWCQGGSDGLVTPGVGRSSPNAFVVTPGSDMVQPFAITSGQWIFSIQTYVPSAGAGVGWVNVMNTYCPPTFLNQHWSTATRFNPLTGSVQAWGGQATSLVTDAWVEYRLEIDLDANTFNEYYNNVQFVTNGVWSDNVGPGGAREIRALDLYSETITGMRFDDASLVDANGCYPDCDTSTGVGVLDIFDFLCFQNRYDQGSPYACDCDVSTGPGNCDIFDFLCFQNAYDQGCP